MPVSGDSFARPDRCRSGTMDNALETRGQRVRDHLRRPLARRPNLLRETAGNTVTEIVPPAGLGARLMFSARDRGRVVEAVRDEDVGVGAVFVDFAAEGE